MRLPGRRGASEQGLCHELSNHVLGMYDSTRPIVIMVPIPHSGQRCWGGGWGSRSREVEAIRSRASAMLSAEAV
jgi:hypothetical protein